MEDRGTRGAPSSGVSWFRRPRRRLVDSLPSSRIVMAMWMFPYVCLGVLAEWLLGGGPKPESLLLNSCFAGVALIETVYLVLWLRRPVERRRPVESQRAN